MMSIYEQLGMRIRWLKSFGAFKTQFPVFFCVIFLCLAFQMVCLPESGSKIFHFRGSHPLLLVESILISPP